MKFSMAGLLLTLSLPLTSAVNPVYVTYQTASDVTEHANIDLDMRDILLDIANGKAIYENGANSNKSGGVMR